MGMEREIGSVPVKVLKYAEGQRAVLENMAQ